MNNYSERDQCIVNETKWHPRPTPNKRCGCLLWFSQRCVWRALQHTCFRNKGNLPERNMFKKKSLLLILMWLNCRQRRLQACLLFFFFFYRILSWNEQLACSAYDRVQTSPTLAAVFPEPYLWINISFHKQAAGSKHPAASADPEREKKKWKRPCCSSQ